MLLTVMLGVGFLFEEEGKDVSPSPRVSLLLVWFPSPKGEGDGRTSHGWALGPASMAQAQSMPHQLGCVGCHCSLASAWRTTPNSQLSV